MPSAEKLCTKLLTARKAQKETTVVRMNNPRLEHNKEMLEIIL